MSTAHRPTWDPAQAREVKGGSRQYSSRDMAAHTKLKFRQPGQTSSAEVAKLDLRAELFAAEEEARERKRKAEGLPPTPSSVAAIENGTSTSNTEDESNKRRKLLQETLDLDKDDDEDEEESTVKDDAEENGDDDDEDDDDDDEDETAELLRELEKIKRERAEEKARQEREKSSTDDLAREFEVATSNPLLNLQAALGQASHTTTGGFTVKRRWDDDLIFKNQAMNDPKHGGQFVNDLLRTEFHNKPLAGGSKMLEVRRMLMISLKVKAAHYLRLSSNNGKPS